jgi:hypothetical protein
MNTLVALAAGFITAIALVVVVAVLRKRRNRRDEGGQVSVHASIQELKAIGQLSVFKVLTKEIVTEVDHEWGEIGKKYLSWILSNKKMAMIFMFEIDFRYDLRSPSFQIIESDGGFLFRMPPCLRETSIRDIHFYDEQKSKLIPWLVPDLLNSVFRSGFTEEDRNRLKDAARKAAQSQSEELISTLGSEVEQSAKQTLESLARAFGVQNVRFEFPHPKQEVVTARDQK